MTYEPIIYQIYHDASLYGFLWGLGCFLVALPIAYFNFRRDSDFIVNVAATSAGAFIIPFIAVMSIMSMTASSTNHHHLEDNVKQKYNVQGMELARNGRSGGDPTKTDPQEVKILSDGKTRVFWLIQNSETSEPTLLDYDNGKPVEDLLRKP